MPFDPMTLDLTRLVETNRRLNRRCQKAEHAARKYRRRYVAMREPARVALLIAHAHINTAKALVRDACSLAPACFWCRWRLRLEQWLWS